MTNPLLPNALIKWQRDDGPPLIERVLAIDPLRDTVWAIDIEEHVTQDKNRRAWPVQHRLAEVTHALATDAATILGDDPAQGLIKPDPDSHKGGRRPGKRKRTDEERRDDIREVLEPLVSPLDWRMFYPDTRGPLIAERTAATGMKQDSIRLYLRRYWQNGQLWNGVLPRYAGRSGRRLDGKPKAVSDKKRGAPTLEERLNAAIRTRGGVNVDETVSRKLRSGYKAFVDKSGIPFTTAYIETMRMFFRSGLEVGPGGGPRPKLLPADERPTIAQFQYWSDRFRQEDGRTPARSQIMKEGQRRHDLRGRPTPFDTTQLVFGPGRRAQFDATVGDCYLLSADRKKLIGRPVIYLLIDWWSRLIMGFAVVLEGPSWVGAAQAIANCAEDKVEFCKRYGIAIEREWWPCQDVLPYTILGDRGESLSRHADYLTKILGVHWENASAFRADWKGIVERGFRWLNDTIIEPYVPGKIEFRKPGEPSNPLDGQYTLRGFTKLLIWGIIEHNLSLLSADYNPGEYGIIDGVEPIPAHLWPWGLDNAMGALLPRTQVAVHRALLPRVEATIVPGRGMHVPGTDLYYTCASAESGDWFARKLRKNGRSTTKHVTLAHNMRTNDFAYLDDGDTFELCWLQPRSAVYAGWHWQENEDYVVSHTITRKQQVKAQEQVRTDFDAPKQAVKDDEMRRTAEARANGPLQTKGIPAARAAEKAAVAASDAWGPPQLGVVPLANAADSPDDPARDDESDEDGYVAPVVHLDTYQEAHARLFADDTPDRSGGGAQDE